MAFDGKRQPTRTFIEQLDDASSDRQQQVAHIIERHLNLRPDSPACLLRQRCTCGAVITGGTIDDIGSAWARHLADALVDGLGLRDEWGALDDTMSGPLDDTLEGLKQWPGEKVYRRTITEWQPVPRPSCLGCGIPHHHTPCLRPHP